MGSHTRRTARWALALATVLAAVLASLVLPASTASAGQSCHYVRNDSGGFTYSCTQTGDGGTDGTGGSDGSGSGGGASCTLVLQATFCMGTRACWYEEWGPPWAIPQGKPPGEDAEKKVRTCVDPGGGGETMPVWVGANEPQPPSLQEQAQTAFGQLKPALGTLSANPATTSLVSLPTWFWAEGLDGQLTGSSAFGLRAIAEPDHLDVDPGDGSGSTSCPWTTTQSDVCSHVYDRASSAGGTTSVDGHPAYAVTAEPVWTVSFEMNGNPVNIPGAPTELRGPQMTKAERVAEVQALVDDVR
jgi:hypothetical protein